MNVNGNYIIDGNAVYEIDEECVNEKCKDKDGKCKDRDGKYNKKEDD